MKDKSTGINEGDLQGSIYHATRMFKENLMRVTDGRTKLINLFLDVNIKRYADGNLEISRGFVYWGQRCRMYAVFENEEDRKNGIVVIR